MTWWQIALIVIGYLFLGICTLAICIRLDGDEDFDDGMDFGIVLFWPLAMICIFIVLIADYQIFVKAAEGILKIFLAAFYTIKALIFKGKGETK